MIFHFRKIYISIYEQKECYIGMLGLITWIVVYQVSLWILCIHNGGNTLQFFFIMNKVKRNQNETERSKQKKVMKSEWMVEWEGKIKWWKLTVNLWPEVDSFRERVKKFLACFFFHQQSLMAATWSTFQKFIICLTSSHSFFFMSSCENIFFSAAPL